MLSVAAKPSATVSVTTTTPTNMELAIQAVKAEESSIKIAARRFGVSYGSLYRRLTGKVSGPTRCVVIVVCSIVLCAVL